MAHEISNVSGINEVFVAGQPAWHGLGQRCDAAQTSAEAIKLAGLDWNVEQRPLTMPDGCEVPDTVANVRKNSKGKDVYLGAVSKSYRIVQNREAFAFFDEVVGEKLAIFETAGALKEGRKVWMLAKLPGEMVIGKKDNVNKYLLLANSHDATSKLRMFFTPVRVVCNNTLTAAMRGTADEGISISHVGKIEQRVEEAVRCLGVANKKYQELEVLFNKLAQVKVSPDTVIEYHKACLPDEQDTNNSAKDKARKLMFNNYINGRGAEMAHGTMWGAYNSVTEFYDHSRYEGKHTAVNCDGRMESLLFGTGFSAKRKALELAVEATK